MSAKYWPSKDCHYSAVGHHLAAPPVPMPPKLKPLVMEASIDQDLQNLHCDEINVIFVMLSN